jgi:signal transduction histidine kinase
VRSIRSFLLARLLLGTAIVLAGAGLAVYVVVARSLERQLDAALVDRVQGLASLLFQEGDAVEFEFSDQLMPEYGREAQAAYFELSFADGSLLERSNSLGDGDLAVPASVSDRPVHWTAALPDGREGRYAAQVLAVHHVYPEEGPKRPVAARVRVVVALGLEELAAAERTILAACLATAAALTALLALIARSTLQRGLEPARRLAAALDAVDVDDLPDGLDVGALPAELRPTAEKADLLIRRMGAALQRERRTTADIAHELRTPISEMVTASEVALRGGADPAAARCALATVREVAWRMGRSVSTLLQLARLEAGTENLERGPVDLAAVVADALRPLSGLRRERGLAVDAQLGEPAMVDANPEALRIVVENLLGNALQHAPRGDVVLCRLEAPRGGWRLVVENAAPELGADDVALLTEPFWRKDGARADRERSGLGLALSGALARRCGLRLAFELAGGRLRATLEPVPGGPAEDPDDMEEAAPTAGRTAPAGPPRPGTARPLDAGSAAG